jgi:uncharacterized protein (TIGR02145 family)
MKTNMRFLSLTGLILIFTVICTFSQVAISTDDSNADGSAMLDVKSTNKGFLIPRMTHAQMDAISAPANGLMVFCNDCGTSGTGALAIFTDGKWNTFNASCLVPSSPSSGAHLIDGSQITWTWNTVQSASGYKWNITNDYGTAEDLGSLTTKTETGLTCNIAYTRYIWAYNLCGESLATTLTQTTNPSAAPVITTTVVTNIVITTATSGGNISPDVCPSVIEKGVCWSTSPNPISTGSHSTDGIGTGAFESNLTGLTEGTLYYVRAYATNSVGTSYGNEFTFTTLTSPTVTTAVVTNITQTTATSGGNVTSDGGASIAARGVCWSTSPNPLATGSHTTDAGGSGIFESSLTGLTEGTLYYVRAYATNSVGTAYGNETSFTTSISDNDGNTYKTLNIGSQVWMSENLKATKYKNGTDIPLVTDNTAWSTLTTPGYCWYGNNEAAYKATYGALYNWYTVNTGNLCPAGWHVPTDSEFTTLTTYLGGESVAGGKLKETGTTHWTSPNTGATNETGFTALPGGGRFSNGTFDYIGNYGYWWSDTENATDLAWYRSLLFNFRTVGRNPHDKEVGFSVRCLKGEQPTVTTDNTTNILQTTATSGGNVTSDGGASVTARGVCWSTSPNPISTGSHTTNGSGTGIFESSLTGLTGGTLYYVRAYATNSVGTSYGNELTFTTLTSPTVATAAVTNITQTTATSGGNVTSDGGATVSARGVCWSTSPSPTIANDHTTDGNGTGAFVSSLTGLSEGSLYYVRAYATNIVGTAYGNEISFTTSISDNDGNTYKTLIIGSQVWMAENLKTTKYKDGTAIPLVTDGAAWAALITPGYCWYNNDEATYEATYGALYNWYTVNTGNLCPTGWHVPNDAEWTTLTTYLGGESVAGGKLKETGTTHWTTPNTGATNETGFTALPGGYRYVNGLSFTIGGHGYWWSSTEYSTTSAWFMHMSYYLTDASRSNIYKKTGCSVRCVRN